MNEYPSESLTYHSSHLKCTAYPIQIGYICRIHDASRGLWNWSQSNQHVICKLLCMSKFICTRREWMLSCTIWSLHTGIKCWLCKWALISRSKLLIVELANIVYDSFIWTSPLSDPCSPQISLCYWLVAYSSSGVWWFTIWSVWSIQGFPACSFIWTG